MKEILLILSITIISLYAQTLNFKETKFVEALELYTYRDGNISYDDTKTIVKYRDGKTITKVESTLTVHNDENELLTTIDLNKKPEVALYFRLSKALFTKKFESLKENFKIEEKDKKYQFEPIDDTKEVVSSIELSLNADESVDFFIINFTNRDTIKIEAK
jgi:hypothetical protein